MGIGYLLDTNVVSEVRKRNGSSHVKDWIGGAHGPTLYLSSLTVGAKTPALPSFTCLCRSRPPGAY